MKITAIMIMLSLSLGTAILSFQKPTEHHRPIASGMRASVNNEPWVAQTYHASVGYREGGWTMHGMAGVEDKYLTPCTVLNINGFDTTCIPQSTIMIHIPFFKGVGVYKIDYSESYSDSSASAFYLGEFDYSADSGTITIFELSDSNIQGAFYFLADSGYKIKNGVFNIPCNYE